MDTTTVLPAKSPGGLTGFHSDDAMQHNIEDRHAEAETQALTLQHSPLVYRHRSFEGLSQTAFSRITRSEKPSVVKLYEDLEAARANRTALQSKLKAAKKRWQRPNNEYRELRDLYEKVALDPDGDLITLESSGQNSATLRARLNILQTELESHCSRVRAIKRELQRARTSVQRSERDFMELSRPQSQHMEPQRNVDVGDPTPIAENMSSSPGCTAPRSTSEYDYLRDAYFRKAADVNIYGEQLADLNYEYWTTIADRERRLDQEEVLSTSDEDFYADAERKREAITQALDKAIIEADELKAQCIAAGLDLDPYRRNIWDLDDAALSKEEVEQRAEYRSTFEAALAKVPSEAFENAQIVQATPSDNASEPESISGPSERVSSWVTSLSPEMDADKDVTFDSAREPS